jgi:hypothetical protein
MTTLKLHKESWVQITSILARVARASVSELTVLGVPPWRARTTVQQMRDLGYLVDCGYSLKGAVRYSAHPELESVTRRWVEFGYEPEATKLALLNASHTEQFKSVHKLPVYTGPSPVNLREGSDAAFKIKSKGF